MQRSEFVEGEGISNLTFDLLDLHIVNVADLFDATKEYLDDNYRGLISLSAEIGSEERIEISDYYLIKLFKKLVSISGFKKLVNVNFCCDNLRFSIDFSYSDGERFDQASERELTKLARNAGFDVARCEQRLIISKEVFEPKIIAVFAKPIIASALMERFKMIFSED
jgi:hypothetical protein